MYKLGALGVLLAAIAAAILRALAKRRAAAAEARAGCLACGATAVQIVGTTRRCDACGYEGRADGGGMLGDEEIAAMYDRGDRNDFHRW